VLAVLVLEVVRVDHAGAFVVDERLPDVGVRPAGVLGRRHADAELAVLVARREVRPSRT